MNEIQWNVQCHRVGDRYFALTLMTSRYSFAIHLNNTGAYARGRGVQNPLGIRKTFFFVGVWLCGFTCIPVISGRFPFIFHFPTVTVTMVCTFISLCYTSRMLSKGTTKKTNSCYSILTSHIVWILICSLCCFNRNEYKHDSMIRNKYVFRRYLLFPKSIFLFFYVKDHCHHHYFVHLISKR